MMDVASILAVENRSMLDFECRWQLENNMCVKFEVAAPSGSGGFLRK
jgi:hypothetical protein